MSDSGVAGEESSRYDGFISYAHAADDLVAPRLQAGLQMFAKPWWRRRALRIFRDQSSLSANPHLWTSITSALEGSDWFVLLTSPEAAGSPWVDREVAWWIEHKGPERILPVLTEGELIWDEGAEMLDPSSSVPPALFSAFHEEPRWVDLRWARTDTELDLRNTRFRSAIADIASALRQVPKEDLESEEVHQHRRTLRTAWGAVGLLAALTVAATGAALYATDQRDEANLQRAEAETQRTEADTQRAEAEVQRSQAENQARIAEARGLAARATALAPTRLDLSLLLAVEGFRTDDSLETRAGVLTALNGAQYLAGFRQVESAFLIDASAEGKVMAAVSSDGEVQLWDPVNWTRLGPPLGSIDTPISLDVSADGTHLAAGGRDGARVWNLATREEMAPSSRPEVGPVAAELSPAGDKLLTMDWDDPVFRANVWELPSGTLLGSIDLGEDRGFGGADFSPDGSRIYATADGGRVAVWDADTLEPIVPQFDLGDFTAFGMIASPKGDLVATSSAVPVRISVLDAETLTPVANPVFPRMGGRLYTMAFSPDGEKLLAQTDDGSVAIIDPREGVETVTLTGRTGFGGGAAWLDSNRLVSSASGAVLEWDLRRTTVIAETIGSGDHGVATARETVVTVNPDGLLTQIEADGTSDTVELGLYCENVFVTRDASLAAAICADEAGPFAVVVDLVDRTELWRQPLPGFSYEMAFSPDAKYLAVTSFGGDLTIFETVTGALSHTAHLDSWMLGAVGWSPDGQWLITGGQLGTLYFLQTSSWEERSEVLLEPNEIALVDLVVHPDERRLFVASESGLVWVVDLETRKIDGEPLDASGTQLQGVALSPDGSLVVATSRDGGIRLWESDSRRAIGPTLTGHALSARPIDFGPAGLYTSGLEGFDDTGEAILSTVRWDLDPESLAVLACELGGRNLTSAEWTEYVPDVPYRATCPQFPPGK